MLTIATRLPGVDAIAAQHGAARAYVTRILDLVMLAPDLTQTALKGKETGGLSLVKLHRNLPLRWDEQHKFTGHANSAGRLRPSDDHNKLLDRAVPSLDNRQWA